MNAPVSQDGAYTDCHFSAFQTQNFYQDIFVHYAPTDGSVPLIVWYIFNTVGFQCRHNRPNAELMSEEWGLTTFNDKSGARG